jgi:hypothetical protein
MNASMLNQLESEIRIFRKMPISLIPRDRVDEEIVPMYWKELFVPGLPIEIGLNQLWKPIAGPAVNFLLENIMDILLVGPGIPSPMLCYVFKPSKQIDSLSCWIGFPPIQNNLEMDRINPIEKIPSSFKRFLLIHNGFLLDGNGGMGILPLKKWTRFYVNGKELFGFCGDGLGNVRCYDPSLRIKDEDYMTVDWDHETNEASDPEKFEDFLLSFFYG